MSNNIERLKYLVTFLNKCTEAYDKGTPMITDRQWDSLYYELIDLENNLKIQLDNSPTKTIHFEKVSKLNKVNHKYPMLSLDKTKSQDEVKAFLGNQDYIAMCKMDGLTCRLSYENGYLVKAETRGNGHDGEDILHNAMVIPSIPKTIPYQNSLIIDGEIICKLDVFDKNFSIAYENHRNFAAGSIRLLDSKECVKRKLTFIAWEVIEGFDTMEKLSSKLACITAFNFITVPFITELKIEDCIEILTNTAKMEEYPIDGIVFKFDNVAYGKSLGATSHHFKNAIAYKFFDETYSTNLTDIVWTIGRTGVLTPVAIFNPIEIEGSTVERASVHNITVMLKLFHGYPFNGQKIEVFKSNMIIPQIYDSENVSDSLHYPDLPFFGIPSSCPICQGMLETHTENDSTILRCTNPNCEGKLINKLDHFCSKKGLDIKGLSKATLEKLMEWGWINSIIDIFTLSTHKKEWTQKPSFGVKSVEKILTAIETSSKCNLEQFIAALGIPLIGTTAAKDLSNYFGSWEQFIQAVEGNFSFFDIPNFGIEMHTALKSFNYEAANYLVNNKMITFNQSNTAEKDKILDGKIFVITGKLAHFKNRDEFVTLITSLGGKVTGSVSKNTNYLINNDVASTSSKNKTAQSLNIPILSEEDFIQTFGITELTK